MKHLARLTALVAGAMLMSSAPARAQTAGATLLVEAHDQSGAPVPGTLVTVTSQETGLERVGTTVNDGTGRPISWQLSARMTVESRPPLR